MKKEFNIVCDPLSSGPVDDAAFLEDLLDDLFRIGEAECDLPRTRRNIYFLRGRDGELEFFCNVASADRRRQLRQMVSGNLSGIPLSDLRQQGILIHDNIPNVFHMEYFSELVTGYLPECSEKDAPVGVVSDSFLEDTVLCVLHVDEVEKGWHVHRLYRVHDGTKD